MSSDSLSSSAEQIVAPPLPPGAERAISAPPPRLPEPPRVVARPVLPVARDRQPEASPRGRSTPRWLDRCLRGRGQQATSFVLSSLLHALLLVVLALWLQASGGRGLNHTTLTFELLAERDALTQAIQLEPTLSPRQVDAQNAAVAQDAVADVQVSAVAAARGAAPRHEIAHTPSVSSIGQATNLTQALDRGLAQLLDGRVGNQKAALVEEGGGTPDSQRAVERGLRWLAAHQHDNGSWLFNHQLGPCNGYCRDPGNIGSTTGATALALLPFLGAGHTHRQGDYQPVVAKGLNYLCQRMVQREQGGDLQEGTMYAQGLAAIALCEAYAMTQDTDLLPYARAAIDFIIYAQDQRGGGWRYAPGAPGDTTVTGWQVMALRSAQMGYLAVPPATLDRAWMFLDGVQLDGGAYYGYQSPEKDPTNTAIGLLCRMFGGWPRDASALAKGVDFLAQRGPSPNNLYFNYYATQVLHHYGGPRWVAWNNEMREYLVRTQSDVGHESGSWHFKHKHGDQGGRLYSTAMALLILEVYYRHLPLYGQRAISGR